MSLIVRFPSGEAIVFRTANYLRNGAKAIELYTANPDKGGLWVADVLFESGAVISLSDTGEEELALATRLVINRIRDGRGYDLAVLKRELQDFDAKKRKWANA